jgi:hypothetical protein
MRGIGRTCESLVAAVVEPQAVLVHEHAFLHGFRTHSRHCAEQVGLHLREDEGLLLHPHLLSCQRFAAGLGERGCPIGHLGIVKLLLDACGPLATNDRGGRALAADAAACTARLLRTQQPSKLHQLLAARHAGGAR